MSEQIAMPFSHIVNKSFTTGIFPVKLKMAKVIPLSKGGDQCEIKNYRPISILPIFDKIIEKLMHTRMTSFLDKHKIINPCQYGFQKHRSTTLAIIDVLSKISEAQKRVLLLLSVPRLSQSF